MNFNYTYTGRTLQEIADKDKKIENLKEKVLYLIEKQDYINLKDKFKELMNEIDNFNEFEINQLNKINAHLEKNLSDIIKKIQVNHIKDTKGEDMFITGATLLIGMFSNEKDFKGLVQNERFKKEILPAFISHESCTAEDQDFIQELFDYAGVSITELYNADIFEKFSENLKIRCFKDVVQELYDNLKEDLKRNKINNKPFNALTNMLSNEDVIKFVSGEYRAEKSNLKAFVTMLEEYYFSADKILEDNIRKPKFVEDFIIAVQSIENFEKNNEKGNQELDKWNDTELIV